MADIYVGGISFRNLKHVCLLDLGGRQSHPYNGKWGGHELIQNSIAGPPACQQMSSFPCRNAESQTCSLSLPDVLCLFLSAEFSPQC
jgi:hypothetical protein